MSCGLVHLPVRRFDPDSEAASHSAELERGDFLFEGEGPLIRPSGTFSPRGEGRPAAGTIVLT